MPCQIPNKLLSRTSVLAIALSLWGCGTTPSYEAGSYSQAPREVEAPRESVSALLAKAKTATPKQAAGYQLQAALQLGDKGETEWAQKLLKDMDRAQLDDRQFVDYSLLMSHLAMEDGSYFLARETLTRGRLEQLKPILSQAQKQRLGELKATLFTLLGETRASVAERLTLEQWLAPEQRADNRQALWQTLMMEAPSQLQKLLQSSSSGDAKGWYELALLAKTQVGSIDAQRRAVADWRLRNPGHPAAQNLPQDLQMLAQLAADKAQKVALLLPTQGKLGKAGSAIRDGFMAAYYRAMAQGDSGTELLFFDTSSGDIVQRYQQAVAAGAQVVIGPLDKRNLKRLNQQPDLPVPVLAMNYIEPPSNKRGLSLQQEYNPQLYQVGLAVEDEARQCAQRAHLEGHRRAMILAPQGQWGNRGARAFREEWEALGGEVVGDERFTGNGDYSRVIENSLQLQQSRYRHRTLQRIVGQNLEFEPRRRQDVHMIFLLGRPNQAKQVKPTLAFHYAGHLPVYATSHIYNGKPDPKGNRDINDIRFTALPWQLNLDSPERRAIDQHANPQTAYQQLYALGSDSFRLYPRLRQLAQVPGLQIQGSTGKLQMLANGQLARQQQWAQIQRGRAELLPTAVVPLSDEAVKR